MIPCLRRFLGPDKTPSFQAPSGPDFSPFDGPLDVIPKTRADVYRTFGDPGVAKHSREHKRKHMLVARNLPLVRKGKLYCHKLAEPYIRESLRRLADAGYTYETIGCYSFRHQRHEHSRPLSYHSWGIALDFNPAKNRARILDKEITTHSAEWLRMYPQGLSAAEVGIMKAVGWRWGGDWYPWTDPMHFQLVG